MRSKKSNKSSGNKSRKSYKSIKSNSVSKKTKKNLNKLSRNKFKIFKKRTKKNRKKNIVKGGEDLSAEEIINNYYLCTQSRYDKPIDDMLRPFGSLDEVKEIYSDKTEDLKKIIKFKEESDKISDVKIVGDSQFGLYFRFVEKKLIDGKYTMNEKNSVDFSDTRSFIFNIDELLQYINNKQNYIPLCWFAKSNAYGYEKYSDVLFNHRNQRLFLNRVGRFLLKNIDDHEFVCRIPIPLSKESGFRGKINSGILNIYQSR